MRKFLLALIGCLVAVIAYASPGSPYLSYGWRPTGGGGSVAVDSVTVGTEVNATSITISVTAGASANEMCVGIYMWTSATTINSVTWNGSGTGWAAVSGAASNNTGAAHVDLWCAAISTTGTHNVVVTLAGTRRLQAVVWTFTGANATTPLGTAVPTNAAVNTSPVPDGAFSSASNQIVISLCSVDGQTGAPTFTTTGTKDVDQEETITTAGWMVAQHATGSASLTLNATASTGTNSGYACTGVPVKP